MCCEPYYDEDGEGVRSMRLEVKDKKTLAGIQVGTDMSFKVAGQVTEVTAPRMVRDYSTDWNGKGKRPMKEEPGKVMLRLDKGDPEIAALNSMLMEDDLGAD
jgi:predicted HicB family RNase H-like nuclease